MFELDPKRSDPRLQLYTATRQKLEQLEVDFNDAGLSEKYNWTGHFMTSDKLRRKIQFASNESSIEADSAQCTGIYLRNAHELTISLSLFMDGSPYCRESDLEQFGSGGFYDIQLAEEAPATIIPSGSYDYDYQKLSDLHRIARNHGEVLDTNRAQNLLDLIASFSIEQADLDSYDILEQL